MNERLMQILDKLSNAAEAYENENAQMYADEILRIQDEKKELEGLIRQTRNEINLNKERISSNANNLTNSFSAIFDIFYQDALRKEKEAKKRLEEKRAAAPKETREITEKLEKVGQVITGYKIEIKNIKSYIAHASLNPDINPESIALIEENLSSVKEDLKISRKEERRYKKDLSNIQRDIEDLALVYEETKKSRLELAAEYEAYKRGYAFKYGEKLDGSGGMELQVYPRRKQIENKNIVMENRIKEIKEQIAELDKREAFLSVSTATKKENIIKLLQGDANYTEIEEALEGLMSYISEEEIKENEQELISSIEKYQQKIKTNDYIDHKRKKRDEDLRKTYQKRLFNCEQEIKEANAIISSPLEIDEKQLAPYRENIRLFEERRKELLEETVLLCYGVKVSAREIRERKVISKELKEVNQQIEILQKEEEERRQELEQDMFIARDKAIKDKILLSKVYNNLAPRLENLTIKLLNPINYIDVISKIEDQAKLSEMQGKLEELRTSDKYLGESKAEILRQFKEEYQNMKNPLAQNQAATIQNQLPSDSKKTTNINKELFNKIISTNANDDGYIMGETKVGLDDTKKNNQMPQNTTPREPIGLPGETIDGTKVGDIAEEVYDKLKNNDNSEEFDNQSSYIETPLTELPGETLDGTKVGDIAEEIYDKLKNSDKGEEDKPEEEEIEEVSSIKDIPRKLKTAIKNLIKKHPILTAATGAIIIGIGALGFKNNKEVVASGNLTTETTIAGKDDETSKIGDTYTAKEGDKVYESSDYDYGGKARSGLVEGDSQINAISFVDKTTGQITEVAKEPGKSIEDVIKENNIDINNSKVRILLGEKSWLDASVDEIKDQMSREEQTVKSEYDFDLTKAEIDDGKVVLHDNNGQEIEINTQKLSQGNNNISSVGSDGNLYEGNIEVSKQDILDDQGNPIKRWSFANVKNNALDILDGLNKNEEYTTKLADSSSLSDEAKQELINSMVEDMANQDYIVDNSASIDNTSYGRGM